MLDDLLDLAANRFPKFTIEAERKKIITKIKAAYIEYISDISSIVEKKNLDIDKFNDSVNSLNEYRKNNVKKNLDFLGMSLDQFGSLDNVGSLTARKNQEQIEIQKKQLVKIESYIDDIDWSEGDVFEKTFFQNIIDNSLQTKESNKEATKKIKEFKLRLYEIKQSAESNHDFINQDIKIIDMFKQRIEFINDTIEQKIIPEMQLVQAFLQCDEIKNNIIANKKIELKKQNNISLLAGAIHNKHYQFIKNTFIFFMISSNIYDTKILTNLIEDNNHDDCEKVINKYGEILKEQHDKLNKYMVIGGDIIEP